MDRGQAGSAGQPRRAPVVMEIHAFVHAFIQQPFLEIWWRQGAGGIRFRLPSEPQSLHLEIGDSAPFPSPATCPWDHYTFFLFQSLPADSVLVLDPQFTFSTRSPWAGWAHVSLWCDPCTEAPHFLPLLGPRPAGPSVCISPLGGLLGTWLVQPHHLPLPLPHVRVTSAPQQHRPNPQCHPSSLFHSHARPAFSRC